MKALKGYTDLEQSKKSIECNDFLNHCNKILAEGNDFLSNRLIKNSEETVYTCDICPHKGNLMCCHNCPNF